MGRHQVWLMRSKRGENKMPTPDPKGDLSDQNISSEQQLFQQKDSRNNFIANNADKDYVQNWGGSHEGSYGDAAEARWKALQKNGATDRGISADQQANLMQAAAQEAQARQQQQQAYALGSQWAHGAQTPQQQQMQQGFKAQGIGVGAVANAATGGARGSLAAHNTAGMEGIQNDQMNALSMQQQQAKDQQTGQSMMMNAAQQMRQGDQSNINTNNEYRAALEANRQGYGKLGDANDLFYQNLLNNKSQLESGGAIENTSMQQAIAERNQATADANMNNVMGGISGAASAAGKWSEAQSAEDARKAKGGM